MADAISTDHALPFEMGAKSPAETHNGILSALESEFSDETEGDEEPAADEGPDPDDAEPEDDPSDEDEESKDESDEEAAEDEPPSLTDDSVLEIDGEKVTLRELKDGRLRQADYTRKTQALAEDRRKAEAEAVEARRAREQYAERLQALASALNETQPKAPDPRLRTENPQEYLLQKADYDAALKQKADLEAEQQRVHAERMADQDRQFAAYLDQQTALLHEKIPEWKDPEKYRTEANQLVESLETLYGWTREELNQVADHRLMLALRDAVRFREGQTKGKEKIQAKIKPAAKALQPGSRERAPQRGQKMEYRKAKDALRRSGRLDDAVSVFEKLID